MDVERGIEREERRGIGWIWTLKKGWSGAEGRETVKIIEEFGPGWMEKLANCSVLEKGMRSVGKGKMLLTWYIPVTTTYVRAFE